ncbi:DNA-directed RNA polymerase subunit beta [Paenibacillus sinopodophylli]|uniref:DNA-directed RNA polymerase subunit beta n=1 Tax=Paenibacillus sinopodophylli TaxID=1837342 RepID=UPI00148721EB|nr:DNA-directed RNA polymerase subunit beta [Paenibacillus sinopodophylli]
MSMADERMNREDSGFKSTAEEGRSGRKKRETRAKADKGSNKKQRSKWLSVLLWILRKSIVPIIMVIMLVAGLYIGYVVIGKQEETDVFSWATWQHLYDLVFADT